MSERNAPRVYGVRVGLVSGLFAIGQVALSVAAAHGSEASLRSVQQTFDLLAGGGLADPTTVAPALLPMLLIAYLTMLLGGLLTLWFAARAGRLAAIAQGRRAGGAAAGMWVWLTSTGVWLLASIVATVIFNSDGTLSGVFFGDFSGNTLALELIFLLLQEVVAALICLGFCALTGAQGARNAPVPPTPMSYPPHGVYPGAYPYTPYPPYPVAGYSTYPNYPPAYPPMYPPQPGPSTVAYPVQSPYPGYPSYPPASQPAQPAQSIQAAGAAPLAYPPPPSHYVPHPPSAPESPAPQPE